VGSAIWQNKCCIAVVVGQRTPVCRADLHRCICPGTSLCQPVLHSSTEQWGLNFAKTSAALQWWWVSAHLYAEHICTGVSALVQACCQPGLQSSPEQWGVRFGKTSAALQCWWVSAHLYAEQICTGVSALVSLHFQLNSCSFIQVCNTSTSKHQITFQGKMHSPLLSAAVQNRKVLCAHKTLSAIQI